MNHYQFMNHGYYISWIDKDWRCTLGFHKWVKTWDQYNKRTVYCERCGKIQYRDYPIESSGDILYDVINGI